MQKSRLFVWWVLLPYLLLIILPAWTHLGKFLGYDLSPTPDSSTTMRYNSQLLQSAYYMVYFVLLLIISFPILPFMHFFPNGFVIMSLPQWLSEEIALLWVSSVYSVFLCLFRWVYPKLFRHNHSR